MLFDLDGTLHDRAETVRRYLSGHVRRFPVPEGYAERFILLDDFGYVSKRRVFEQLVQDFRLDHGVEALLQDYDDHAWNDLGRMPHTQQVLAALRARGLRLGVVTNGWTVKQRECLTGLALTEAFDVVVISEEAGCRKPDPPIYRRALEGLGLSAAEVLFVGDSPLNDVQGPQQAGMRAAWLPTSHPLPEGVTPEFVLADLRDVVAVVEGRFTGTAPPDRPHLL
ncbi:HAD family hydrolase [Deinococcus sonorensis]|uniref:HAD family hydrolase n=2 Tax=Deinococcus sonorensis TaxID=309891 RepID=A0AAU7UAF3_9DEIO